MTAYGKIAKQYAEPCAAANPAIAFRLQSKRLAGRVAELGSLGHMNMKTKLLFSAVAFASPLMVIAFAFACRPIADEKAQMQVFMVGAVSIVLLALIGAVGAFIRKEGLRWFTILPLLVLLCLFGLGI